MPVQLRSPSPQPHAGGRGRAPRPAGCVRAHGCRTDPAPAPPADGRPPASAHPSQKLHKFKQGMEGRKKGRKTNQDHFRAVQIGGSSGCRRNQLMQLSWRPAVDHLPGSRVAVVAVSAGLAPRRAGPRGREEPSARPRAVRAALRGGRPGASPLPSGPGHGHGGPGWPAWAAALRFLQGVCSLSHATTLTACVSGVSLCLLVFSLYAVCTAGVWDFSCPQGAVGTLRNQ